MIFEKQILDGFKGMMYTRCDDNGTAFYFSAADFEGLRAEPYAFTASAGHLLKGYLYSYENQIEGRLIVFDHGFGGGHRAYMKEIELLCRHGYTVLSYDHTGCMESGGESPNGMSQSLCDLNDCLSAIKADARFAGVDISVMGHSWGGFSTLNIAALHPEISHVVVLSGFVCVKDLVSSFFPGILKAYRKPIMELERTANPSFVDFHAVESLRTTDAHVLLIYSDNDHLCKRSHYDVLKAGLSDRENVDLLLLKGKGHNPNYTLDAVAYLGEYLAKKQKLLKKGLLSTDAQKKEFLASWDWNRMTAQDEDVWDRIFASLAR
jgi:pimeloyl-ACP methyl ester carboxylesterase